VGGWGDCGDGGWGEGMKRLNEEAIGGRGGGGEGSNLTWIGCVRGGCLQFELAPPRTVSQEDL